MNNKKIPLFFLLIIALTSCGKDLQGILEGSVYHDQEFKNNMYIDTVLNSSLSDEHINLAASSIHDVPNTYLKTSFKDMRPSDQLNMTLDEDFAQSHKLSNQLDEVKYGFESKLFDGILFCTDAVRISKSRLQLLPSGFGYVLPKSVDHISFIGLYLKAGADTNAGGYHIIDLTVDVSLYLLLPNSNLYKRLTFSLFITNLTTSNYPGFYGFYLIDIVNTSFFEANSKVAAISLSYRDIDSLAASSPIHTTALFIYEFILN